MRFSTFALAVMILMESNSYAQDLISIWKNDFKHQALSRRPKIEARYIDATRTGFEINAEKYALLIDLQGKKGHRVRSFTSKAENTQSETLAGDGAYLQLKDAKGRIYSSLNAREASRINIYRRGPYYIETHWLDVQLADNDGNIAPIKGEVIFYSYPEKTHLGIILHVTSEIEVSYACMVFDFSANTCASMADSETSRQLRMNDFCLIVRDDNTPTCTFIYPAPNGINDVTLEKIDRGVRVRNYIYNNEANDNLPSLWHEGDKKAANFELLPLEKSDITEYMEAELRPLLSSNFQASMGKVLGYDPIRGCYKLQTNNPGYFSYHYYQDQNAYEKASFTIKNDGLPRKIYILHETKEKAGAVECGVLLDEDENVLPIMVQTSKNFSGENEEPFYNPNDTPFSETYFPIHLKPEESRSMSSLHLYQNWGNHPLKQISSLGAWMDYYHMSTGVTETTCYVPFLFGGLSGVHIADFRPMSQDFWENQPQHDNVAGHSFLRYRDGNGIWHYIEYAGTTFRSTGPNWADFTLDYISDDGKVKVSLDIFELPQTDELRNFVKIRIEFLSDVTIYEGNSAENMRILNISSWVQGMRYTHVAYGGPLGEPKIISIKLNDKFTISGEELPSSNAFAAIYPDKRGANAFIIRRFDATFDKNSVTPGISVIGQRNGDTTLMLVPKTKAKRIKKGDKLEADIILMAYGGGTQDEKPAQKCAFDYGLNEPKISSVTAGKKLSDFPARIELDESGKAIFSITGGYGTIPVIVEGAKDYRYTRLYNIDSEKKLIPLSRPNEKDGYQTFVRGDDTFGFVFLIEADGKEHKYLAE